MNRRRFLKGLATLVAVPLALGRGDILRWRWRRGGLLSIVIEARPHLLLRKYRQPLYDEEQIGFGSTTFAVTLFVGRPLTRVI